MNDTSHGNILCGKTFVGFNFLFYIKKGKAGVRIYVCTVHLIPFISVGISIRLDAR